MRDLVAELVRLEAKAHDQDLKKHGWWPGSRHRLRMVERTRRAKRRVNLLLRAAARKIVETVTWYDEGGDD